MARRAPRIYLKNATYKELSNAFIKLRRIGALKLIGKVPPSSLKETQETNKDVVEEYLYEFRMNPINELYADKMIRLDRRAHIPTCCPDRSCIPAYVRKNKDTDYYIEKESLKELFDYILPIYEKIDPGISRYNSWFLMWLLGEGDTMIDVNLFVRLPPELYRRLKNIHAD